MSDHPTAPRAGEERALDFVEQFCVEYARLRYERMRCAPILACSSCIPWDDKSAEDRAAWIESSDGDLVYLAARSASSGTTRSVSADVRPLGGPDEPHPTLSERMARLRIAARNLHEPWAIERLAVELPHLLDSVRRILRDTYHTTGRLR